MNETISLEDEGESLNPHKVRITNNQFAVMVDFMTLNPELIRREFTETFTKEHYLQKWEELTALLNADFTGAKKDLQSWRKCWRDRKSHLKIKAEKRDSYILEGIDPSPYQLTDLEQRLLELIKENTPDNDKYVKNYSNRIKTKSTQKDVRNLNVQQLIKNNTNQIFGISNKQEGTSSNHQVVNNPANQLNSVNNIPKGVLPTSYVLLTLDAKTIPLSWQTVTPLSSTLEPSNNILMQTKSVSCTSVKNDSIPNPSETIVSSNEPYIVKDFESKCSNKGGIQDSEKANNSEKIHADTQEAATKEKNLNFLVSKSSESEATNNDENNFMPRSKFEEVLNSGTSAEDSVEKPPRKKLKFINHSESLFLREDQSELVQVIKRQNHVLDGMARSLVRIEKLLEEKSAEEAQRKNSMLVKISDSLEQLGESLKVVSKSLKSIGE